MHFDRRFFQYVSLRTGHDQQNSSGQLHPASRIRPHMAPERYHIHWTQLDGYLRFVHRANHRNLDLNKGHVETLMYSHLGLAILLVTFLGWFLGPILKGWPPTEGSKGHGLNHLKSRLVLLEALEWVIMRYQKLCEFDRKVHPKTWWVAKFWSLNTRQWHSHYQPPRCWWDNLHVMLP